MAKIIIFRKGGYAQSKKIRPFKYGTDEIEIINNYSYLKILFSQSMVYDNAVKEIMSKANLPNNAALSVVNKIKKIEWDSITTLFEALVKSTVLYASPVALDT